MGVACAVCCWVPALVLGGDLAVFVLFLACFALLVFVAFVLAMTEKPWVV